MFGQFDARLRRLEALSPDHAWLHESGLASLLVYAWLRPLPWDMPNLDAEDEVIGLAEQRQNLIQHRVKVHDRPSTCLPGSALPASGA